MRGERELEATEREAAIADACIRVLAASGSRGLTHRAVDRDLGLPVGSAGNYFPTRASLLAAGAQHLVATDLAEMVPSEAVPDQITSQEFGRVLTLTLLSRLEGPARDRLRARLELLLDTSLPADVRELLATVRAKFHQILAAYLAAAGCPSPQPISYVLVAYCDGLLFDQLLYPGTAVPREDLTEHITALVRACVTRSTPQDPIWQRDRPSTSRSSD